MPNIRRERTAITALYPYLRPLPWVQTLPGIKLHARANTRTLLPGRLCHNRQWKGRTARTHATPGSRLPWFKRHLDLLHHTPHCTPPPVECLAIYPWSIPLPITWLVFYTAHTPARRYTHTPRFLGVSVILHAHTWFTSANIASAHTQRYVHYRRAYLRSTPYPRTYGLPSLGAKRLKGKKKPLRDRPLHAAWRTAPFHRGKAARTSPTTHGAYTVCPYLPLVILPLRPPPHPLRFVYRGRSTLVLPVTFRMKPPTLFVAVRAMNTGTFCCDVLLVYALLVRDARQTTWPSLALVVL